MLGRPNPSTFVFNFVTLTWALGPGGRFAYYLVSDVPLSMLYATLVTLLGALVSTVVFLRNIHSQYAPRSELVDAKFDPTKGYPQDDSLTTNDCALLAA